MLERLNTAIVGSVLLLLFTVTTPRITLELKLQKVRNPL